MNGIDRAMAGASGAPLSKRQKRDVCMLADLAWQHAGRPYYDADAYETQDPIALAPAEALELWRHEEQARACGKKHLTACTQRDFPWLMAHFLRAAGQNVIARQYEVGAALDPLRQARAKLEATMAEVAGAIERPREYAAAIARCKFKTTDLEALSPRQVWVLVFDLRRAAQRRRKTDHAKTQRREEDPAPLAASRLCVNSLQNAAGSTTRPVAARSPLGRGVDPSDGGSGFRRTSQIPAGDSGGGGAP